MLANSCHWAPREHSMSAVLNSVCHAVSRQVAGNRIHVAIAVLASEFASCRKLSHWITHWWHFLCPQQHTGSMPGRIAQHESAATSGCFQYMVFLIVARRCGLRCDVVLGTATAGWWHPTKQNPRLRERLFVVTCSSHVTCFLMLAHCRLRLLFTTQRRREASTASKQGHYTFQL